MEMIIFHFLVGNVLTILHQNQLMALGVYIIFLDYHSDSLEIMKAFSDYS